MKKLTYFFILTVTLALMASCSKDGATGPAGAAGPTGAQGPVGPAGPAGTNGTNGSVIYSGTTVPGSTTGAVGDFYLNTATSLFYGPKTSSGWGTGFSLKGAAGSNGATGATGATGAAGSKINSGSGAPASTLGAIGDYYLNVANYMFYGPKTSAGWGVPINLQGPAGPEGNANVQTTVFSLTNSQWLWNSQYEFQTSPSSYTEYFTRYCDNSVSTITQNILDAGEVMVYFTPNTSNNTNQWAPLPYEFTDGSGNFNYEMAFETNVGTVRLHYFFVQLVAAATIPVLSTYTIATYKFKVVVVSGTLTAALKKNNVNLNDYNAVSKFTGLWLNDKDQ